MAKSSYWWETDPKERFWLEVTNRRDIGKSLQAPLEDSSGDPHPGQVLFQHCSIGDIVFHYDTNLHQIVGNSTVVGTWKYDLKYYYVPIGGYSKLLSPITLNDIQNKLKELKKLRDKLISTHKKQPIYFSFQLRRDGTVRASQGYSFKLPYGFLKLFPEALAEIGEISSKPKSKIKPPTIKEALDDNPDKWQDFARRMRRGQGDFRKNLLQAYDVRCALTGHGPAKVLEAVHIAPHAETGINKLDNGLLMRADLHYLFDANLIKIDPDDFTILVDASLIETPYWELNGKQLRPRQTKRPLSSKFLRERWDSE